MGLRDTAEQLEAAQAQSIRDERTIETLRASLDETESRLAGLHEMVDEHEATIAGLGRQNAELEHDLARAESALADRLQHDAHTCPTAATIDRGRLLALLAADSPIRMAGPRQEQLADAVLALVRPVDGVVLTAEEAQLAVRACRHSAESIRSVLDVDPARLHPDVAPYVERLTDLADRLQEDT